MDKRKVLVTGASGYIAAQVLPKLRERFTCRLIDARDTDREGNRVEGLAIADLTGERLDDYRSTLR